jgi:trk system potassium uptake protein
MPQTPPGRSRSNLSGRPGRSLFKSPPALSRSSISTANAASRYLEAAFLLGAGALAALAQQLVHMPEGYFGATGEMTTIGLVFVSLQLVLALSFFWQKWLIRRAALGVAVILLAINVAFFLAPVATDPVIAGAVILWHIALISRFLFPTSPLTQRAKAGEAVEVWLALQGPAVQHLLLVALVASVAVVGFRITDQVLPLVICFVLDLIAVGLSLPFMIALWRGGSRFRVISMLALLAFAPILVSSHATWAIADLAIIEALILVNILTRSPTFQSLADLFSDRPEALISSTFLLIIGAGTLFLSFPVSSGRDTAISPVDALFTATSAVCVTGLATLDTPTDFSTFGHVVILLLIQIGGLNIMVLSTFTAIMLGRGLSLRGERVLGEMLDLQPERSAFPLVRFIVTSTLAIEAVGAGLLAIAFMNHGESFGSALWKGVFHSISAFCNAGFALQSTNLVPYQEDWLVIGTISALIIAGGLGFAVLAAAWARTVYRRRSALATQVKLVLLVSAALLVVGTVLFTLFEWNASLAHLDPAEKWLNGFFQSVTPRTAGFNSVDMSTMRAVSIQLTIALMFVGASPGSTGGGIKTTTAAVLLSVIPAIARGRQHVVIFERSLPLEIVYRSAAITVISATIAFVGSIILLATQDLPFDWLVFEVFSALGTVGLSVGATPKLDTFGKILICAIMFFGRIGPLTLTLLLSRQETSRLGYPEARVMVG